MRRKPIEQTIRLFQPWRCVGENDHRRPAESTRAGEADRNQRKKKERRKKNWKIYDLALVS